MIKWPTNRRRLALSRNDPRLDEYSEEELAAELARRRAARSSGGLRAIEVGVEQAAAQDSRQALETILQSKAAHETGTAKPCPRCGRPVPVKATGRTRTLRAISGEVSYSRNYHYCSFCNAGFYPLDEELGLPRRGDLTPEFERRVLDFGVNDNFVEAAQRMGVHYARPVSENLVRRVVDRQADLLESAADQELQASLLPPPASPTKTLIVEMDGSMVPTRGADQWREVKLGVIVRDDRYLSCHESSRGQISQARYVAHLGGVDVFRQRLDAALRAERANEAGRVVCIADGAPWIWNVVEELCPGALQLLDWPHAKEAASTCSKALFGVGDPCAHLFVERVSQLLWEGELDTLQFELDRCLFLTRDTVKRGAITDLKRYYSSNRGRLRYSDFRHLGLPVGSGIVESANKHVIQPRMKKAGQHWGVNRGDRMAQLRAAYRTTGAMDFFDSIQRAAA